MSYPYIDTLFLKKPTRLLLFLLQHPLVKTLGGAKIDVVKDAAGVGVSFNGGARSNVVIADVLACNGVIHAIDSVIL